jgi:hypothetical protein
MVEHLRRNAVGYLALFVALGGVSYAAVSLPAGSVGTRQLRANAVTGAKIAPSAVTGSDIRNGSLSGSDIRNGTLSASDFRSSSLPQGPPGEPGSPGQPGAPGLSAAAGSDDAGVTPPTGPTDTIKQVTINLQQPGTLVVMDAAIEGGTINNTSSGSETYLSAGVYVDGTPVPGTGAALLLSVPPNTMHQLSAQELPKGELTGVGAGQHTVALQIKSSSGASRLASGSGRLVVVATGQ